MKRPAAGAHLPTPSFLEPAKRPYDRADYSLDCSFLTQCKHRVLVFTIEWIGARPVKGTVVRSPPNEHPERTGRLGALIIFLGIRSMSNWVFVKNQ